jgi:NADH dehydrogenase FAD-containing subunit
MLADICLDISGDNRASLLERLREKKVNVITSAKVIRMGPGRVDFETDGSESAVTGIDTVVLAMGAEPVDTLGNEINKDREVYVIGDAKCPRTALEAVAEASEIGRQI